MEEIEDLVSFSLMPVKLEEEIITAAPQDPEETSDTPFVAAIISLSVVVFILLAAGFVGWWFWIRPTEWKHIEETASVNSASMDNQDGGLATKTTEEMAEKDRPSVTLNGHTWTGERTFIAGIVNCPITIDEPLQSPQTVHLRPSRTLRTSKRGK